MKSRVTSYLFRLKSWIIAVCPVGQILNYQLISTGTWIGDVCHLKVTVILTETEKKSQSGGGFLLKKKKKKMLTEQLLLGSEESAKIYINIYCDQLHVGSLCHPLTLQLCMNKICTQERSLVKQWKPNKIKKKKRKE